MWVRAQAGARVVYGRLTADAGLAVWTDAPWQGGTETEECWAPGTYQLLAPTVPSKIVAVGRNYADHAAEMQATVPVEPVIFSNRRQQYSHLGGTSFTLPSLAEWTTKENWRWSLGRRLAI
jgi:2-keto-4-pentenoate hydratase/2-oxohepta-3-ene-1,7-dioic acid hydratase (catechol pathway)